MKNENGVAVWLNVEAQMEITASMAVLRDCAHIIHQT